jgi:succinate dehydrogenase/fumarate reductase flavoprotein subunit
MISHGDIGMEHVNCDVLVLGSGSAGLRAALSAREADLEVLVVSKGKPGRSTATWMSSGVMAGSTNEATLKDHLDRTLLAGRGINQRELVEILVKEAPLRLNELKSFGIQAEFQDGFLFSKGRPPVQGHEIVRCLMEKNQELGTQFVGNVLVTDLVMHNGVGAVKAYRQSSDQWIVISAKAVILATGGAAALYLRHDNPKRMFGDGYILAIEAGAVLQDMEFEQFYPLCLAEAGLPSLLIPPKLADCGRLINEQGEDILDKYGIQERPAGERARDRLSQALFNEAYRNGQAVCLDLRSLSEEQWRIDPFSAAMAHILGDRYGAKHRPVRVAPAGHHTMGGVRIDGSAATSVPGLFAAGEVTGGLHGANRSGGNALSETFVFGARAGSSASNWAKGRSDGDRQECLKQLRKREFNGGNGKLTMTDLQAKLRKIMWDECGILRNRKGLVQAIEAIKEINDEGDGLPLGCRGLELADRIELQSATKVAGLIVQGALKREESRGAHFREDFPEQDDKNWCGHLQVRIANGEYVWNFQSEQPTV